jgi:restriction system protein
MSLPPRPDGVAPDEPHRVFLRATAKATGKATMIAHVWTITDTTPLPSILLQSVVEKGEKVEDGAIIEAVAIPWFNIVAMIEKDPSVIYQIDDRRWEEMIAGWYKAAGFDEVILTPHSCDFGRDVIAVKRGMFTVRIIDQVKAYKPGHLVTANDVRALSGVLQTDHQATKGIVTTTSDFAPMIREDKFIKPLIPYRLQLVNGTELIDRLKKVADEYPQ